MTKVTGGLIRLVVGQVEHTIHSQYIPKYGMVCYSIEYCSVHRGIATQATRGAAALAGWRGSWERNARGYLCDETA